MSGVRLIVLALAAAAAAGPAPCVDCEANGDEESVLLQKQGVMVVEGVDARSQQALEAQEAASRKAAATKLGGMYGGEESSEEVSAASRWPVAAQYVVGFTPYFSYQGELKVQGTVGVVGTGLLTTATQALSWELSGVDPRCKTTPEGVKNACGIHIHEGTSCYENAGGHYWNESLFEDDPWATVTYKTRTRWSKSRASGTAKVVTGLTNFEVLGHTIIVHDYTGARVACGVIIPQKLTVPAFTPYFDYEGNLAVRGSTKVAGVGAGDAAGQVLSWRFEGLDPKCKFGANSDYANSCGVHIHAGTDCTSNAGGHYWNKTTYTDDPWSVIGYKAHPWFFKVFFSFEPSVRVVTGFVNTIVNGHAMIVHNYTGGRIACGIIAPHTEVANAFVPYFSYGGDLEVGGWVQVMGSGVLEEASQVLSWQLSGVDPACRKAPGPDANPNACGIHIHVGTDCTSDAGGHYYAVSTDPWTAVKYKACALGTAKASGVPVVTGLTNYQVLGHTMIVHDSTGGRIACGILNIAGQPPS